ncbi:hypothetical protein HK414_18935 [Ramlibacter terrae]|uniref:DUF4404 family protein n=1 Tax=Ramlibacter terrae TaxID=2732511 RepID=A0ABX6P603_9BURK|nr:hypothetical protein HK414_18935 [Ramlibacter terrae]
MRTNSPATQLDQVSAKTDEVQRELEVASAELGLTHGALDRNLPPHERSEDVARAIAQNEVLERKVAQAAEDPEEVVEMLEQVKAEVGG